MKKGITLIETMIALLVLGIMLIPIFGYLSGAVKDTERIYTEAVALTRAQFIMDTMLFQIPYKAIRQWDEGNGIGCRFKGERFNPIPNDPPSGLSEREKTRWKQRSEQREKEKDRVNDFLGKIVPKMFGDGCVVQEGLEWRGEGKFTDSKGFVYYCIAKVTDIDDSLCDNGADGRGFFYSKSKASGYKISDLVSKGYDGKVGVIKKIVVQVLWVPVKGVTEPQSEKYSKISKSIFLVGFKSNLD